MSDSISVTTSKLITQGFNFRTDRILSWLPKPVAFFLLRLLYRRNELTLTGIEKIDGGRFWIHHVGGTFFATEVLNWYLSYKSFDDDCRKISLAFYSPQPGDTIIDLGAGLGEEMVVYSHLVGQTGRVYSVEANPRVFRILKLVRDRNHFDNSIALNLAISDAIGPIEIEDAPGSYISSSLSGKSTGQNFKVEGMGMDDFIEKFGIEKVDLLKVNIEGAERFVVNTLDRNFDRVKNFAISCHDFRWRRGEGEFYRTKDLVINFFQDKGLVAKQQRSGFEHIDDWIYVSNNAS